MMPKIGYKHRHISLLALINYQMQYNCVGDLFFSLAIITLNAVIRVQGHH